MTGGDAAHQRHHPPFGWPLAFFFRDIPRDLTMIRGIFAIFALDLMMIYAPVGRAFRGFHISIAATWPRGLKPNCKGSP